MTPADKDNWLHTAVEDHEKRIRSLEKWVAYTGGAIGTLSAVWTIANQLGLIGKG